MVVAMRRVGTTFDRRTARDSQIGSPTTLTSRHYLVADRRVRDGHRPCAVAALWLDGELDELSTAMQER
jgi:hypothetical protein